MQYATDFYNLKFSKKLGKLAAKHIFIAFLIKRTDFKIFSKKKRGAKISKHTKIVPFFSGKTVMARIVVILLSKIPNEYKQMSSLHPRAAKIYPKHQV